MLFNGIYFRICKIKILLLSCRKKLKKILSLIFHSNTFAIQNFPMFKLISFIILHLGGQKDICYCSDNIKDVFSVFILVLIQSLTHLHSRIPFPVCPPGLFLQTADHQNLGVLIEMKGFIVFVKMLGYKFKCNGTY